MLFWRNFYNAFLLAIQAAEEQKRQVYFDTRAWDIDAIPWTKLKASKQGRDAAELDLVIVHVTGVKGGFGVVKYQITPWLRRVRRKHTDIPQEICRQLTRNEVPFTDNLAQRLALWTRYRDTPYHEIAAKNGDVVRNRRLSQRSYHGNEGNEGAGFAVDCSAKEELDDWRIKTAQAGLRDLIENRMRQVGNPRRLIRVAPHRATSKKRRVDTNRIVWQAIVRPVILELENTEIDYEYKRGTGLPVPVSWDGDAHYDDKGRNNRDGNHTR